MSKVKDIIIDTECEVLKGLEYDIPHTILKDSEEELNIVDWLICQEIEPEDLAKEIIEDGLTDITDLILEDIEDIVFASDMMLLIQESQIEETSVDIFKSIKDDIIAILTKAFDDIVEYWQWAN